MKMRKSLDDLPWIVTLLLVLFVDPVYGALYRLSTLDTKGIVVGIIWFVTGGIFGIGWLVDIITVLFNKKITFIA